MANRNKNKKGKKSLAIGDGLRCPKCRRIMIRYGHGPRWKPKPRQPYYFEYWDRCGKCHHLQHYEKAKVWLIEPEEDVEKPVLPYSDDIALEVLNEIK